MPFTIYSSILLCISCTLTDSYQTAVNNDSEPNPSWLTKDPNNNVVYCVDEGLSVPNGSLASYQTSPSGELTQIDRHSVISGPVSSVVYNKGQGLAVAH